MGLPEELQLRLEHEGTQASFLASLRQLGLDPKPYHEAPGLHTFDSPSPAVGFPQWQSPRHVTIAGQRVYVQGVGTRFLELSLSEGWRVSPRHIEAAEQIEALLASIEPPVKVIDPPEDTARCLCPQRYPHIWEAQRRSKSSSSAAS